MDAPVQLLPPSNAPKPSFEDQGQIKLLQVSAEPIFNLGGVGLLVLRLVNGLPANYRVDLACPDANENDIPAELSQRIHEIFVVRGAKWSQKDKRAFLERLRNANYDLIHFHGGTFSFDAHVPWRSPLHAMRKLGIPWVYTNHCVPAFTTGLFAADDSIPRKILKSALAYISLAWLITSCPRPIFVSRENQKRIANYFPWAKSRFTTIYPTGLDGQPPAPGLRKTVTTIGNLGHIAWRKGQFDLLNAFCLLLPKFPQLKLLLVGPDHGDCGERIRNEIAARKLEASVSMPGGTKDPSAFWNSVDIYAQPSHYEGAPMSLMEALWHGKPSVGTRVSGIPEIIEHEVSGLLVQAHKPAELAAAIERLIRDAELRERFSIAGPARIFAQGMTRPQMVKRYLDVYRRTLAWPAKIVKEHATC